MTTRNHAALVGEEPEVVIVNRCLECDVLDEDSAGEPLYECSSCGERFTRSLSADGGSHRCPHCNKFGAKLAEDACAHCDSGELSAEAAVFCVVCEEWVPEDDWAAHIEEGAS